MSLINKMLQDLDARGSQGGDPLQAEIRPVERTSNRIPLPVLLVSALSGVALAAGGYFALRFYEKRAAAPAKPAVVAPAPKPIAVAKPIPAPAPVVAAPAPVTPPPVVEEVKPEEPVPTPAPAPVKKKAAKPAKEKAKPKAKSKAAAKPAAQPKSKAVAKPSRIPAAARPVAAAAPRAEAEYQRALASVAEGRVSDAIGILEQALRLDPRHEGARQTLIGLLIENKRNDEAMRQLQSALALDARQPSMAMLLARLQIERGGDGIETLMRTLPAAAGKADYHAFLAGALARAQRHREAAEQYQAALRSAPDNGVWLMGLGIALQNDGRNADALTAFQRARASGKLSAELQAFVERKINQLAR